MPSPVVERSHLHRALSAVPWSLPRREARPGLLVAARVDVHSGNYREAVARVDEIIAAPPSAERGAARRRARLEGAGVLAARRLA